MEDESHLRHIERAGCPSVEGSSMSSSIALTTFMDKASFTWLARHIGSWKPCLPTCLPTCTYIQTAGCLRTVAAEGSRHGVYQRSMSKDEASLVWTVGNVGRGHVTTKDGHYIGHYIRQR